MPQEPATIALPELLGRLAAGHAARITVLTPNRRLAAALQRAFDAVQLAAGHASWEAPDILPYGAFLARCHAQVHGALAALERHCAERSGHAWLVGEALTQADISVACFTTHLREAVPWDLGPYPALAAHVARCEALDVFRRHYLPFDAPVVA